MSYYREGIIVRLRESRPEDAERWLAKDQDGLGARPASGCADSLAGVARDR